MRRRPRTCCSPEGVAAAMKQGQPLRHVLDGRSRASSIALESRLNAIGLLYLDAPISGGAAKAASGQMTMMTAGAPEAYAKAGGALDAMAAKVYRLGDRAGNGSKVKIINQLLAGVHIAAAAEAMALGLREGLDPATTLRRDHPQRGQQLDVREPDAARRGRRLHAAVGRRHLREGPRAGPRYRPRDEVSAAHHGHRPPDVHAGLERGPRARGRFGGDQDLPRHRASAAATDPGRGPAGYAILQRATLPGSHARPVPGRSGIAPVAVDDGHRLLRDRVRPVDVLQPVRTSASPRAGAR